MSTLDLTEKDIEYIREWIAEAIKPLIERIELLESITNKSCGCGETTGNYDIQVRFREAADYRQGLAERIEKLEGTTETMEFNQRIAKKPETKRTDILGYNTPHY